MTDREIIKRKAEQVYDEYRSNGILDACEALDELIDFIDSMDETNKYYYGNKDRTTLQADI